MNSNYSKLPVAAVHSGSSMDSEPNLSLVPLSSATACGSPHHILSSMSSCGTDDSHVLPPEIIDAIIDQLGIIAPDTRPSDEALMHRRATLGACALVSSSWLPRSRFYLFREVHLPPNDFERCNTFSALLSDSRCTIMPYVRRLIIRESTNLVGLGILWFNDALPQLALLPNIETLVIFGARFDRMRPDHWSTSGIPFFSHMKNVKELHLTGCQFRTPDQCLDALAVCESLEKLVIRRTSLDMDTILGYTLRLSPLPIPPPRLHSLSMDSHRMGNYDSIMRWLGQTPGYEPRISTLILERVTDTETLAVAQFLKQLGPTLQRLEILVVDVADEAETQETFCRHVDLGQNPSLHTVTFDQLLICEPYPARREIAKYVPLILRTIKSPMKEMTLRVSINVPEDLDVLDWDDIIATIRYGENWRGLQRIIVSGPRRQILKQSELWLAARLGALDKRIKIACTLGPKMVDTVLGIGHTSKT